MIINMLIFEMSCDDFKLWQTQIRPLS